MNKKVTEARRLEIISLNKISAEKCRKKLRPESITITEEQHEELGKQNLIATAAIKVYNAEQKKTLKTIEGTEDEFRKQIAKLKEGTDKLEESTIVYEKYLDELYQQANDKDTEAVINAYIKHQTERTKIEKQIEKTLTEKAASALEKRILKNNKDILKLKTKNPIGFEKLENAYKIIK